MPHGKIRTFWRIAFVLFFASATVTVIVVPTAVEPVSSSPSRRGNIADLTAAASLPSIPIHDLAVTRIDAPILITVSPDSPSETDVVSVAIQNRSDHDEVIDPDKHHGNGITTGLIRLKVMVIDDDDEGCQPAEVAIRPPAPVDRAPTRIKPMQGYDVSFDVTLSCRAVKAKDPKDRTPWDYAYSATVHHEVLDGNKDSDPSDDSCPREPIPPKRGIEDRGCGWRLRGQPFGPNVTDVVLKPTKKR